GPRNVKFTRYRRTIKWATKQLFKSQVPVASFTHFVVKLSLAAPESFLSAAALLHDAVASDAHFVMKLLSAAPASFFSSARSLQVCLATAPVTARLESKSARARCFMASSRVTDEAISSHKTRLRALWPQPMVSFALQDVLLRRNLLP